MKELKLFNLEKRRIQGTFQCLNGGCKIEGDRHFKRACCDMRGEMVTN